MAKWASGGVSVVLLAAVLAVALPPFPEHPSVRLHHPDPPVAAPGGGEFAFWRPATVYTRTYHVDAASAAASDANPGSAERPFRSIGRAAELLRPGERVMVHPGIYRECIRPAHGGNSPAAMIGYHAAPGGAVVVSGAEPAETGWRAGEAPDVWSLDLAGISPGADSPFAQDNLPDAAFAEMDWAEPLRGTAPCTLPRGLVFQGGRRLRGVADPAEMRRSPGTYWTDRAAHRLHVHTLDAAGPVGLELTVRQACLRPRVRGLGFIEVRGFVFERVGNGFPRPQEGALSVGGGHHWLIEGNTVREANGIGIDIGDGWYGGGLRPAEAGRGRAAWNIVRGNRVVRTGICGIAGLPARHALIEGNILADNTFHAGAARIYECAGIKTHMNQGTLIQGNLVSANPANGIWMDWDNRGLRCTRNVVVDCATGILIEASVLSPPCSIDRNVVWRARVGICEQDCSGQTFVHNLIGQAATGVALRGKVSDRRISWWRRTSGGGHLVANNLLVAVGTAVEDPARPGFPPSRVSGNASGSGGPDGAGLLMVTATDPAAPGAPPLVAQAFDGSPWPAAQPGPGPAPPAEGRWSVPLDAPPIPPAGDGPP